LTELLNDSCPSNSFDTAAWAYYNLYIIDQNIDDLKESLKYAKSLLDKKNNDSKQKSISIALQKSHFQEIMHTANENGLLDI
jgi:hypothetical protein